MKRIVLKILTILFLASSSTFAFTQSLIKVQKSVAGKMKFGYVDNRNKIIIPYGKYDFAYSDTIDSLGYVLKKGKDIVAINNKGKELFKVYVVDNGPDYPINNIFRIVGKGKIGLANTNGFIILNPKYDFIRPFSNGYAAFNIGGKNKKIPNSDYSEFVGGKWGFLDQNGVEVIPPVFDEVLDFK
ncbi:WG repeat-containing protein, partial [uncultured Proteiniphilum sp.]|uniref:WG repeat-containing protein n=1 Tax=uncultured Proteiniphilum sp. TaxID=497637 RepID=UPI000E821ADA